MNEDKPKKKKHWLKYTDNILEMILIFILIVLCAGSPDLLDVIIERVRNG